MASTKVLGIGIPSDGVHDKYLVVNGIRKNTRLHSLWRSMLTRCYVDDPRRPAYNECSVDPGFHDFQDFSAWAVAQKGYGLDDWQLDKDSLIKGNKIYGPNTCVFLPRKLNMILTNNRRDRGPYPLGVKADQKRFCANCNVNGRLKYLGGYATPPEAFIAYKAFKEKEIKRVADIFKDDLDPRAYAAFHAYKIEITD